MDKNGFLRNTSTDSKEATFVILKNHASVPIRKERSSPTSKARMEDQSKQVCEKGRCVRQSPREVNHSKNRARARLGFVKPIQNRLSKEQKLTKSKPSRAEIGLAGRENGVRLQKEE